MEKIKALPAGSGVYLMKNRRGEIIYVGKATSLKNRVSSYFQGRDSAPKTQALVSQIANLDYIETRSAKEALLLEFELIKRFRPRYNVMYRDDKSYPYLKLTWAEKYPRLLQTRMKKKDGAKYYGPYPDGSHLRRILHYVRKYFPLRYCKKVTLPDKPCFYLHLRRCPAPCTGQIDEQRYRNIVREVDLFLRNKHQSLLEYLDRQMAEYSRKMEYEQARRVLQEKEFITQLLSQVRFRKIAPEQLLKTNLDRISQEQFLPVLQHELGLRRLPAKIEAFDISNISGTNAVGSMVTFLNGSPAKSQYRRFRIRTISGIDDYAMLREVLQRRYQRLLAEKKELPDLILIDGGKGHLAQGVMELKKLGLEDVPVASIAKKEEHIFLPGRSLPVVLDRRSPALQLVRHVRDEAHRFAITYHRLLRKKAARN